jgi:hypothetical protein
MPEAHEYCSYLGHLEYSGKKQADIEGEYSTLLFASSKSDGISINSETFLDDNNRLVHKLEILPIYSVLRTLVISHYVKTGELILINEGSHVSVISYDNKWYRISRSNSAYSAIQVVTKYIDEHNIL